MLRIGYPCLTVGEPLLNYRTLTQKYLTKDRLYEVISNNLATLKRHIIYNFERQILVFRISSDLIPFGSSLLNSFPWADDFAPQFQELKALISQTKMRISMHPGQYSVLNSPHERVVTATIRDLEYHQKVIALLGGSSEHKIILHIGGIYGDKEAAVKRFIAQYKLLSVDIKKHLVIENDDHFYDLETVLGISYETGAPVIFDLFHHQVLPSLEGVDLQTLFQLVRATWRPSDGRMKIHYSEPDLNKRGGAHSQTIGAVSFLKTFESFRHEDIDIMLEVKDKNISAIKCHNLISTDQPIEPLEYAWSQYKYLVLEHDHQAYQAIRELLKHKSEYPVLAYYQLVEKALHKKPTPGGMRNAAMHVWGYFKKVATDREKKSFEQYLQSIADNEGNNLKIKRFLRKLAFKYNETYLIRSLYLYMTGFIEIK